MTNNILTLQKAGRLTCTWVPTGNPHTPLACVWAEAKARSASTVASSPDYESGRMLLCA
jgi:hypothetical protein